MASQLTPLQQHLQQRANRQSLKLSDDQRQELLDNFSSLSSGGSLDLSELKAALDVVGIKLPQWQVRQMIDDMEKGKGPVPPTARKTGGLSLREFEQLCSDLKSKDVALTFKTAVSKRENLETLGGMSEASSAGTTHSVRHEEQVAFSDWINSNLARDPDLKHLLPIDTEGKTLYDKVKDGILLCKIINHSCPDTIDERAINKKNLSTYAKHENLTLALSSAQAIGCSVVSIDAHDLSKGKPHLVLGLLWQIIRIGLFNQITLKNCPELVQLLSDDEDPALLLKMSPETILLRWVNHHLERAGSNRRVNNFTNDIKDSEVYATLLKQIAPVGVSVSSVDVMVESNLLKRAEVMLQQAEKLHCRHFLAPADVVEGVYKLNLAFVANLFNNHPALDKPDEPIDLDMGNIEESREEKTYRNWMNSLGVSPYVNWLYSDLADGLIIFQLFDIIKPGVVNWTRVHRHFSRLKMFMEKLENCNYAVDLGKVLKFSLVGIAGADLADGNPTLTLALVWQLMRAYTLSILSQLAEKHGHGASTTGVVEKEIVEWANNKVGRMRFNCN